MKQDTRSTGTAATLLRWLVLLVVWFDLVGSPLHPHHHDLGPDHFKAVASAALDGTVSGLNASEVLVPGHSQAALRSSIARDPESPLDAIEALFALAMAVSHSGPREQFQPLRSAALAQSPPHLRPESRAPPPFA